MIYLQLFSTFLLIGTVSFGGGYGMIPLIREMVLKHGWLTEAEVLDFIAVSESTPGPVAINMATFIGSSQAGILGSACATLGVILPAFIIILLIAAVIQNLLKYNGVRAFLNGVRPCAVGLILATAVTTGLSTLLGFTSLIGNITFTPEFRKILIFVLILIISIVWKKKKGKKPSPILMIIISAVMGMILYSF